MKLALRLVAGAFAVTLLTLVSVWVFGQIAETPVGAIYATALSDEVAGSWSGVVFLMLMLASIAAPVLIVLLVVAMVRDAMRHREHMRANSSWFGLMLRRVADTEAGNTGSREG